MQIKTQLSALKTPAIRNNKLQCRFASLSSKGPQTQAQLGSLGLFIRGNKCALDYPGNLTALKMTFATASLLVTISLESLGLACVEIPLNCGVEEGS